VKGQDLIYSTIIEDLHLIYTTSGVNSVKVLLKVCHWLLIKYMLAF